MPELLYLDTARLGQMSPRARRASVDFARFASEYGGSLYLTDFLRGGVVSLPKNCCDDFPGIGTWQGVSQLKHSLRILTQSHRDTEVLLAARSANVMKLSARLLTRLCRNVLTTDLTWPAYERILQREKQRAACCSTRLRIRKALLQGRLTENDLVERFASEFLSQRCDGLFLPLVDNLGIRLPIRQIVRRIEQDTDVRFVVVDGAQAINHVDLDLTTDYCDFLVAGCHKWLRAFTPMGLGFYGHPRSRDYIGSALSRWAECGAVDDPLLTFSQDLEMERQNAFGETVAVSSLLTTNGAVQDALARHYANPVDHSEENRNQIRAVASVSGWRSITPDAAFSSRIMLLKHSADQTQGAEVLRRRFIKKGVSLTAYDRGLVRISLPERPLSSAELARLRNAF